MKTSDTLAERVAFLGEQVKDRYKQKEIENESNRKKRELEREASDAPDVIEQDFYCDICRKDVIARGQKQEHADGMFMYHSKCPKGHKIIRYITEKWRDPYWNKSPRIRRDREKYADDMLTPNDPRFRKVYPAKWAEIEKRREELERANKENHD